MRFTKFFLCFLISTVAATSLDAETRPNLLLVTVDDMSADSVGTFGCPLETTPHMDSFARQSLRFRHAHVQVGNCMPGRNIMFSGLLAHVNGVEGFVQNKSPDYPVLCDLARAAGYFTAIYGKVPHSTPFTPYAWDAVLDQASDGTSRHKKDPHSYGSATREGIELSRRAGQPFCLVINISDPHKPFYGFPKDDPYVPTRVFTADEVPVPGFLPDDDVIREELASYYSSVRRADDAFGAVLKALEASGSENTFVMFWSDHGMPLPFAKTQLYHHSTHTPLMVRWPSITEPGTVDDKHMVSAVDFLPTLLDVIGHSHPTPARLQGRSFAPLLRGESQADRDFVILQYNENSGRSRHPMRGIHTREYLYLYNPWSNGKRKFATATTGTATYRQLVQRAKTEPQIAARLDLFDYRVLEELYDIQNDPDCLFNLAHEPQHQKTLQLLRDQLARSLAAVEDPVAPLLAAIDDGALRKSFMAIEDEKSRRAKALRQQQRRRQGK